MMRTNLVQLQDLSYPTRTVYVASLVQLLSSVVAVRMGLNLTQYITSLNSMQNPTLQLTSCRHINVFNTQ